MSKAEWAKEIAKMVASGELVIEAFDMSEMSTVEAELPDGTTFLIEVQEY